MNGVSIFSEVDSGWLRCGAGCIESSQTLGVAIFTSGATHGVEAVSSD
jgi:hypothetical protein